MKHILEFYDEQNLPKGFWKKKLFWRILYWGLKAKSGIQTVWQRQEIDPNLAYSVGGTSPAKILWDEGFSCQIIGKVFGERICMYTKT